MTENVKRDKSWYRPYLVVVETSEGKRYVSGDADGDVLTDNLAMAGWFARETADNVAADFPDATVHPYTGYVADEVDTPEYAEWLDEVDRRVAADRFRSTRRFDPRELAWWLAKCLIFVVQLCVFIVVAALVLVAASNGIHEQFAWFPILELRTASAMTSAAIVLGLAFNAVKDMKV